MDFHLVGAVSVCSGCKFAFGGAILLKCASQTSTHGPRLQGGVIGKLDTGFGLLEL